MVKRQVMKARINEQIKLMKKKKERYLAPIGSKRHNMIEVNNEENILKVLDPTPERDAKIVISEYKGFAHIGVKPYEMKTFDSQVYFAPLPEFGYDQALNIYFLVFENCTHKGCPARAVAADITYVRNFDIFPKYYLLRREDFMIESEQFVFDGVAALADMEEYCFPGKEGLDVQKIKKGFKSINDTYREEKAGMRRNLFILEPKKTL